MKRTIRAVVKEGLLRPLEEADLPEGKEVTLTIVKVPSERNFDAFVRSAGGWKGTIDAETLIRNIYADRLIFTRPEPRL